VWPFLGILGEIAILAALIYFLDIRPKAKQAEIDSAKEN
jgi:hypothetical protein